jgi:hypothetical protein
MSVFDDSFDASFETGDFTVGDKTTAAGDGAVAVAGNNTGDILSGDGAVDGSFNTVNNGNIMTGDGSPVTIGDFNDVDATSQKVAGDLVQDNKGPVIDGVDTGGGNFTVLNPTQVQGNQTITEVEGDLNGSVDASNTSLNNVGNTDNSQHNVGNTTDSFNTTGSHNTTTDVTGFEGGNIGLPGVPGIPGLPGGVDAGDALGVLAGGAIGGPIGLLGGAGGEILDGAGGVAEDAADFIGGLFG